jgi:hypothetical protein
MTADPSRPPASSSQRLRLGVNTLGGQTPLGFYVSGKSSAGNFSHPFRPALGANFITFSKGLVDGFEPVISEGANKVPISGYEKHPASPRLSLDAKDINTVTQESWACVEVTPTEDGEIADAKGQLAAGVKIEVLHRSSPTAGPNDKAGRHPLALILWNDGRPMKVFEITFFNLRYFRTSPAPGGGPQRHYFF